MDGHGIGRQYQTNTVPHAVIGWRGFGSSQLDTPMARPGAECILAL